jgi:hypothetical protein
MIQSMIQWFNLGVNDSILGFNDSILGSNYSILGFYDSIYIRKYVFKVMFLE